MDRMDPSYYEFQRVIRENDEHLMSFVADIVKWGNEKAFKEVEHMFEAEESLKEGTQHLKEKTNGGKTEKKNDNEKDFENSNCSNKQEGDECEQLSSTGKEKPTGQAEQKPSVSGAHRNTKADDAIEPVALNFSDIQLAKINPNKKSKEGDKCEQLSSTGKEKPTGMVEQKPAVSGAVSTKADDAIEPVALNFPKIQLGKINPHKRSKKPIVEVKIKDAEDF